MICQPMLKSLTTGALDSNNALDFMDIRKESVVDKLKWNGMFDDIFYQSNMQIIEELYVTQGTSKLLKNIDVTEFCNT